MQNAELRELTASEELSIEQEYAMQQSWLEDSDSMNLVLLFVISVAKNAAQFRPSKFMNLSSASYNSS